jgi:hypothetical protein
MDRDTAVVGAPGAGSAYIFTSAHGNEWVEVAKLTGSEAKSGDGFGSSVAVSGDTVVVGAWGDDEYGRRSGAAYIFARGSGGDDAWREVVRLTASDAAAGDDFGASVGISGHTVVVGASAVDGWRPGSAYVFSRNQGGRDKWGEVVRLSPPLDADEYPDSPLAFGHSVAVSGSTVVVGAYWAGGDFSGAAYIFNRSPGGTWSQPVNLGGTFGGGDYCFGYRVAISGNTTIVGTGCGARDAPGIAHVFARNQGGRNRWGQVAVLNSYGEINEGTRFSMSVAMDGHVATVGGSDFGVVEPTVSVFTRSTSSAELWTETAKLTAEDELMADDLFGSEVAISGRTIFVGAPALRYSPGSVYVFRR